MRKQMVNRISRGLNILTIAVMAAVLVMGYILLSRQNIKIDLTQNKQYTLSEQTRSILDQLTDSVRIMTFFKQGAYDEEMVRSLLEEYDRYSDKITFKRFDPDKNPRLATQYGINRYGTVVFEYKDRRKDVQLDDIFTLEDDQVNSFSGERAFTNAVLSLTQESLAKLYVLTGHEEKQLESEQQDGLSSLSRMLKNENYEVETLNLTTRGKVPDDASAVIIPGARRKLGAAELDILTHYLQDNGRLCLLTDPGLETGLEPVMKNRGIQVEKMVVIDEAAAYFFDAATVVPVYNAHAITQDLMRSQLSAVLPVACPVTLSDVSDLGFKVSKLLSTTDQAWGEVDLNQVEIMYDKNRDSDGPFVLAALSESLVTENSGQSRLAVFGDSEFITNAYLGIQGNIDLFLNTLSFLVDNGDLIGIRAQVQEKNHITLSGFQPQIIMLVVLVFVPFLIMFVGVSVWWERRRL